MLHQNKAGRASFHSKGLCDKGFEWRYHTIMANDHCCVNCCNNDKFIKSEKDLPFYNFPSNKTQTWQWIAAIKWDEGHLSKMSATSHDQRAVKCASDISGQYGYFLHLRLSWPASYSWNYSMHIQRKCSQLWNLDFSTDTLLARAVKCMWC